ncbi:MAG TPA: thymidine phosphorylase [Actinomycetota bacterium]|nr:thymidine phosphorylase [Actinomycetota bacterium]
MSARDYREVVAAKRDGRTIAAADLEAFVLAYGRGEVPDALASAFLMACVLRGLDAAETLAMTQAMIASGDTVSFPGIGLPTVDKHSTGGVADGVTLVFAPLAAALGVGVAKLSGRGLGHTGGTLDKLESIPGLRTDLSPAEIESQVSTIGCAVAAQSANLVPADGALYALRDATATVPSTALIAASVMSKKLAVGTDLILLDVKAGSGAFMKTADDARGLARACLDLARGAGRRAHVSVTDMSQPLGTAIGNALDVAEAVRVLRGEDRGRLAKLCAWFAARASIELGGTTADDAARRVEHAIASGAALERLRRMVEAQGGDPHVVDDPGGVLPSAPVRLPLAAPRAGTLAAVDAEALGLASAALGAGRRRKGDAIDPAVGIVFAPKIGDRVEEAQPIGEVHARTDDDGDDAVRRVLAAIEIVDGAVEAPPLVIDAFGEGRD